MNHQTVQVMTIANSIIGVSILTMPYCFKQCGIILSTLILIISSIISRLSCHLLLKSAIIARRRTFEFLAFHTFGSFGKFFIEIGIIGFLFGTCIAFFVVMGDLGPAILANMTGSAATATMRTSILMALALFCVLPLGLLRNIDSLSSICAATIAFYFCLVLKVIAESVPHLIAGDWVNKVEWWRPAGILQCLPIFSMALFCQTQIFEIYQSMPNASLEKMNDLIRAAVNICTGVYIFVGVFGYIGFSGQTFSGNILMSFSTSLMSDVMKIGFVLSLACSFPLVIFPCRASLYSLLYKGLHSYTLHDGSEKYIPEGRFKGLTFTIVFTSLVTGVMIPNIELVLGLVGSTIGIMICVLFPAMCYISISTKNTNERLLAQLMVVVGLLVMILGTYANIYAIEEELISPVTENTFIDKPHIAEIAVDELHMDRLNTVLIPNEFNLKVNNEPTIKGIIPEQLVQQPVPLEINEMPKLSVNPDFAKATVTPDLNKMKLINLNLNNKIPNKNNKVVSPIDLKKELENVKSLPKTNAPIVEIKPLGDKKKVEEVDIEAIKKEDKEVIEQQNEELQEVKDSLKLLTEQKEKQKKFVEDSEKVLEELQQKKRALEMEKELYAIEGVQRTKLKAAEAINEIAQKAIKEVLKADTSNKENVEYKIIDKDTNALSNQKEGNMINNQNDLVHKEGNGFNNQKENSVLNNQKENQINSEKELHLDRKNRNEVPIENKALDLNTFSNKLKDLPAPPLPIILSSNFSRGINNYSKIKDSQSVLNLLNNISLSLSKAHADVKNEVNIKEQISLIELVKTKEEKVKEETVVQHREIRSINDASRNTDLDDTVGNLKNNCDKTHKIIRDEKVVENPMFTTLFSNLLIDKSINSNFNKKIISDLKPISRDLKSYHYRRKK